LTNFKDLELVYAQSYHNMIDYIKEYLQDYRKNPDVSELTYKKGQSLYMNGQCTLLTRGQNYYDFLIDNTYQDMVTEDQRIEIDEETGEVVMRFKLPV